MFCFWMLHPFPSALKHWVASARLIERNTTIPAKKSQVIFRRPMARRAVEIHVLQGEREMAQYNNAGPLYAHGHSAGSQEAFLRLKLHSISMPTALCMFPQSDLGLGKARISPLLFPPTFRMRISISAVKEAGKVCFAEDKKRKEKSRCATMPILWFTRRKRR